MKFITVGVLQDRRKGTILRYRKDYKEKDSACIPFFVTVCRDMKFITVGVLQDRRKGTILGSIRQAIN
jgi:hypothetical protein